jgi:hypothetical protein
MVIVLLGANASKGNVSNIASNFLSNKLRRSDVLKSYNKLAIYSVVLITLEGITGCRDNSVQPVISRPQSQNRTTSEISSTVSNLGKSSIPNDSGANNMTGTLKLDSTITFTTYRNELYGFAVNYLSNWRESPKPTDGDGRGFTYNTQSATYSNMMEGYAEQDAVIVAVGNYNVANWTYEDTKKEPNDSSIISYSVIKIGNGWETKTIQRKGTGLWYTLQYGDKNYVKTLQVLVPDGSIYESIAMRVLRSYKPV